MPRAKYVYIVSKLYCLASGFYIGGLEVACFQREVICIVNGTYHRGELYFTDFGVGMGSEQMGCRPAVILQNDTGNQYGTTVIVAPITTDRPEKADLPTHVYLDAEAGLTAPSIILGEQIRTISKDRLMEQIGMLSAARMQEINSALLVSLGIRGRKERVVIMPICKACIKESRIASLFALKCRGSKHEKDICACCNRRMGRLFELVPKV